MKQITIVKTEVQGLGAEIILNHFTTLEALINGLKVNSINNPEVTLLSRKEVADFFNISLVTLHKWTKKGVVKSYKIGNKVRFKKSEVLEALKIVEPSNINY